jgi:predicted house-cleaning noncanonical NTP pyrophosphatase (MazG superfamily)
MMKKHLHVNLSAESILEMISEAAHNAMKKSLEGHYLSEEEYKEIIHSNSGDLHELIRENLHGTVECKLLDVLKLIKAYFDAREMDEEMLMVMLDKSRE